MDISVVVPCYNAAPWVGETISSILAQTHPPTEVIAVNDGSTDGTRDVLARFGTQIRVIDRVNGGLGAARNTGAVAARAEWLAFLDADDLYVPDALSTYHGLHEAFPEARVLFADFVEFEEDGRILPSGSHYLRDIGEIAGQTRGDSFLLDPPAEVLIARNGAFTPSCLVLRRDRFIELGKFDECREHQGAEDLDLYFRLVPTEGVAFARRPVVRKRKHAANMSDNSDRMRAAGERALRRAEQLYREKHIELVPIVNRKYVGLLAGWARFDVESGRPGAVATSASLLRHAPLSLNAWWLLARATATQLFTARARTL
jgi:glycosyltransferase involved in cell wall biosynthesis